ncbi:unnamed protein product (macronuclear) [Paramecium tetraurelia]|uniref:Arrestin C-terminal-like domain-containing protein n=1 Tax=Paramecium tetraurelia TaxID=5888 RepID=A0E996_PARTE|nr:uncharacterized protein GSPATT00024594001 [Paramecium tetraurelia]CAK91863.1 unnamed protein product [Paramecium tetraurelia]|eukprot:XP_001459260.1 hypothetical protein (macronuclear) [Paramecium tetraurelia strain d4-2]
MITKLDNGQLQVSLKVDKANYRAGDVIKGVIYLKAKTPDLECSMLFLKLIGVQKVNQFDKQNQFFRFKDIFYTKHKWLCNFGSHLTQGIQKRHFEIETPQEIPSFCINYYKTVQCRMQYILSVYFTDETSQTLYKIDQSHKITIHIHHLPSPSLMQSICYVGEQKELKKLCFLNGGSAQISLQINKQGFAIGDVIEANLEVDNTKTDLNLLNLTFSVQSQLIILYPVLKLRISNYFGLSKQAHNIVVKGGQKRQLEYKLKLEQDSNDPKSIFPQSTLFSDRIIYHYNFCLIANYSQNFYSCNQLTFAIPIHIFQQESRQQQYLIDMNGTLSKQKAMFSDHKITGYGPLDGAPQYSQSQNAEDSFEEDVQIEENTSPSNNFNRQDQLVDYEELENEFETVCATQLQQSNKNNQQEHLEIQGFITKKVIAYNDNLDIIQEENDDRYHHSIQRSNEKASNHSESKIDQQINNDTIFK